jgi:Tfp pilus assembly protein PilF
VAPTAADRAHARSLIEQALALDPSEPEAHMVMGWLLSEEGDLDGAIAASRTAVRLKPDVADTHYLLGGALRATGLKKQAAQEFRDYLRLAPDTPDNGERIRQARAWLREPE